MPVVKELSLNDSETIFGLVELRFTLRTDPDVLLHLSFALGLWTVHFGTITLTTIYICVCVF